MNIIEKIFAKFLLLAYKRMNADAMKHNISSYLPRKRSITY